MVSSAHAEASSIEESLRLEVLRGRLQSIVDESAAIIIRTAFSVVMSDAKDFACAVLSPQGSTIAQSAQSIPVFLSTMTRTAGALMDVFPAETWEPGDVYATNDTWLGTGHLYDISLVSPVFVDGEIVAISSVVGHLPDIGGRIVGTDAVQCFEEGFRIPPTLLVRGDQIDSTLISLLRSNVRMPDQVVGDLSALLNATHVIGERTSNLVEQAGGHERFADDCQKLESLVEAALREKIRSTADGVYRASIATEGVAGKPFEIHLSLTISGDSIVADFEGTSAQIDAGVNACLNYTTSYITFAVKSMLGSDIPFNQGILRPITVVAPDATVVNSRFPAPGAARSVVGHYIPGLVFRALASALPHAAIGDCGAPRPTVRISGVDPEDGDLFTAPVYVPGGFGGRSASDGPSSITFPTNNSTIPVEMIERDAPLIVESKELITDSGGAGTHRGGLGQRIVIRSLAHGLRASIVAQRIGVPPEGVHGGLSGTTTKVELNGQPPSGRLGQLEIARGDRLVIDSPGGGGYGEPANRDPDRLRADIRDGYVSVEKARSLYGYADGSDGAAGPA